MHKVIIACDVLKGEIESILKKNHLHYPLICMDSKLHVNTNRLRTELQRVIDYVAYADVVLLCFGRCGNATVGLHSDHCEIRFICADDCISIFTNNDKTVEYLRYNTYFLSSGWIKSKSGIPAEYIRCEARYGDRITKEIFSNMLKNYTHLQYIDTGLPFEADRVQLTHLADKLQLTYGQIQGNLSLLEELILGIPNNNIIRMKSEEAITVAHFHERSNKMDQVKSLRKERRELFDAAVKRDRKPKRVPLYSNMGNWMILERGYQVSKVLRDDNLKRKINIDFQKKFNYDKISTIGGRNPLNVADALELTGHIIDDEIGSISCTDNKYMYETDYSIILKKGFNNWLLEDYLPRKIISKDTADFERKLTAGMKETLKHFDYTSKAAKDMMELGGLDAGKGFVLQPACILMNWYRGIQNFSLDLRRKKKEVKDTLELMWKELSPFKESVSGDFNKTGSLNARSLINIEDPEYTVAFDHFTSLLSNAIMSPQQFEEFLWPYLKQLVDYTVENEQTVVVYAEADVLRFKDYFNSIPKGYVAVTLEMDNIFEARKQIGDHVTILGGYPAHYLYYKKIDECIDMGKKIMDEVAYDGAYIYSESKIISHKTDAKPENLLTVLDFFREQNF